jgi:5-methyltetrahydropteroyltriglutamate--homocysteine methyltransferase
MISTATRYPPFRADTVGSFLRPSELIEARKRFNGDLQTIRLDRAKADWLTAREDAAIEQLLRFQAEVGLDVATDGEFRRLFYFDLLAAFSGVELRQDPGYGFVNGFSPPRVFVTDKVAWPEGGVTLHDFAFAKARTSKTVKVTLPSPLFSQFYNKDRIDCGVYPDRDAFWADLIAAYRQEIAALAEAGCTYIQIDETTLIRLCDPKFVQDLRDHGIDPQAELACWTGILDAITVGAPHNVTLGMHICRGNGPAGSWISSGGYEPIAEALFNRIGIDVYLLEFDTERAGGFDPLRHLPKHKSVVLGLVSTKSPELEELDGLQRRVDEAGRFVDFDRLALSPQCGFSSDTIDRPLTRDDQRRKLELVVKAADQIWR